jgi:hypothetical protein
MQLLVLCNDAIDSLLEIVHLSRLCFGISLGSGHCVLLRHQIGLEFGQLCLQCLLGIGLVAKQLAKIFGIIIRRRYTRIYSLSSAGGRGTLVAVRVLTQQVAVCNGVVVDDDDDDEICH